ncbi:hypothetical protein F4859DRAFT_224755 [Xylaria cf. heliscus]|nr:hypothetical protein F4859DRAFT_224755 [Xylaria cf. heliscus]
MLATAPISTSRSFETRQQDDFSCNELGNLLREAWADVLDIDADDIVASSHFFMLGGDSMAAVELSMLAGQRGVRLTRQMIFHEPVFAAMAAIASLSSRSQKAVTTAVQQQQQPQPFSLVSKDDATLAIEQCHLAPEDTAAIEDIYPATPLQAGLMAHSLSQPGTYVSSWMFPLSTGPSPDPEWLCEILGRAVQKLPILRTAMTTSADHGFVQVVLAQPPPIEVVRVTSTRDLDPSTRRPPLALGKPLVKIEIAVDEGEGNQLAIIWHTHHAVYDMTTFALIARHISDIALDSEMLPEPPGFASFISYSLEIQRSSEWRHFWSEHLRDATAPHFPYDTNTFNTTSQGSEESVNAVPSYRTDAVYTHSLSCANANRSGFTLANIFKATWAYLLSCYEHSDSVVFGVTSSGRHVPVPGCADMVAPTVTTTPMHIKLNNSNHTTTVAGLLQHVTMLAIESSAWEQVGLPRIRELGADARHACSFRTMVNVQTTDALGGIVEASRMLVAAPAVGGQVEPLGYALVLELCPRQGDTAPFRLSYDSRVLRCDQVVQIAAQLEKVFRFFLTNPSQTLDNIEEGLSANVGATGAACRARKHGAVACGVAEKAVEGVYACTPIQAESFVASLKRPATHVCRLVFAVHNNPSINQVKAAWATLYRTAPVLRSRFFAVAAASDEDASLQLLQAVIDEPVEWREGLDLQEYLAMDHQARFSLGQPLTRLGLIRTGINDDVSFVVLTAHDVVFDGTDAQVGTLLRILNNPTVGNTLPVHAPHNGFASGMLEPPIKEAFEAFWANKLLGCVSSSFPEIPRGHTPLTTAYVRREVILSADLGLMTSAVLQTAWALTLRQYQDSNDIVFGIGLHNNYDNQDSFFGPTNTPIVPQRIIIDQPDTSVAGFLKGVQALTLEVAAHTQFGLSKIRDIDSSTYAAASFQNILIIHAAVSPAATTSTTGATPESHSTFELVVDGEAHLAYPFGLVIEITPVPKSSTLMIRLSFDPAVLEPTQVRRLAEHYEHVLRQIINMSSASDCRLKDINHVPDAHHNELLSWNSNIPEPLERLVHEMFEEQATAQPDAPAICARDGEWTYAELDRDAENLALWLCTLGVGPGKFVPLLFEKCGLAIVVMLAILKAGGACVALDPSHPPERLRSIINIFGDACAVILSSAHHLNLAEDLQASAHIEVIQAKILEQLKSAQASRLLRIREDPAIRDKATLDDTAFVPFTSGSTGTPKGILESHRAFASGTRGLSQVLRYSTGPGSRNFQYTAYTSDAGTSEIFFSLAVGSCVCVPSEWDRKNNLAGSMRDLGVTWAFLTPSIATLLEPAEVPLLRTLILGGETASPENFQTWAPALYLINAYGPTECTVFTHCIPRPVVLGDLGSNIGYSAGCATWIVDPTNYHRLQPIGAVGEILIEGPNLADGYINEPVKTASAFVSDPAWKPVDRRGPMRLYRTGDLARYLPTGMVQFLGRRDHQVKLHGLRIDLDEVEHEIRRLLPKDILVAAEIVTPHGAGVRSPRMLAAFVAPKEPLAAESRSDCDANKVQVADETGLKDLLLRLRVPRIWTALQGLETAIAAALPRHTVPAAYVPLRQMPFTATGKTDRRTLKQLASMLSVEELISIGTVAADQQEAREEPSTDMERLLAQLWATALGASPGVRINVRDSFFKLGGDSLAAMRLVSLARRNGVRLSVEQVLTRSVLQEMAKAATLLEEQPQQESSHPHLQADAEVIVNFSMLSTSQATANALQSASEQLGVSEADIEDIYPCTPLQEGLLALSQDVRGSYVAQMVYELPSSLDLKRFELAWDTVIEHWPILRTRFFEWCRPDGTLRLMQAVIKETAVDWRRPQGLAEYLELDRSDRMRVGDRMLRVALFRDGILESRPVYFVVTAHHAVYDGWMLGLLLNAVRHAYAGLAPAETTPYRAFIAHLETRDAEQSRLFWRRYIGDAPRLVWPGLPELDFRPQSTSVSRRIVTLPPGSNGQANGFTSTAWIRAAFAILLGAYSDTNDIVFASTVYGRTVMLNQGAGEKVAGPTIATVPVRIHVLQEQPLRDLVASVQADAAAMLVHEQEGMQNIRRLNLEALATIDAQALLVVQVDSNVITENKEGVAPELVMHPKPVAGLVDGFLTSAIVLEATVSGDRVHLVATHDHRVITTRQAERFLRQLSHIMAQLCETGALETADLRVADLELIPPEDATEMMAWNANVPEPAQTLVHELFSARAAEQPSVEAVVSWEGALTYQELDELSDRLAAHLWTHHGLRPGMHVPLVFEKSIWAVVAMLAILKVGAAFAAMNPADGPEKLRELAATIDASFVVCSEKHEALGHQLGLSAFCVGPAMRHHGDLQGVNGALHTITPAHTAFLLFTSGSTGQPKAIIIDHAAFCSSMRGHGETLCYHKGSRNLQFTAYTSDVSMGEVFTSLSRGATVCIPSDNERMDDLAGAIGRMQVDWAFLTPSVASLLHPDHVPTLRTLLFGGETATVANVKTWAPRLHLINSFGPAETSIWCHAHPHFQETDDGSDIGWSVGCATWIVDPENFTRLMPIGAIGELVVEGPNVAAGYYNNPAKTQAAFLKGEQLPWLPPHRRNNRVLRLGDLARWMPDGRVQFLGRRDTQVKLHGFKVDVGEVENAIRTTLQDNMAEVAVEVVRSSEEGEIARLVAFISCTPANMPQDREHPAVVEDEETLQLFAARTTDLRTKLASRLPAFMIPGFFLPLTAMPLSASAKTDRKLLRALLAGPGGFSRHARFTFASQTEMRPPTTPMEKVLHGIWSSVLAMDPNGFDVGANFFECGGDSITAMKMVSLARAASVSLSAQDVFNNPRLSSLADVLTQASAQTSDETNLVQADNIPPFSLLPASFQSRIDELTAKAAEVCQVSTTAVLDLYPCTPMQRFIIDRSMAHPGVWWISIVFDITAEVDLTLLEAAWHRVVQMNDTLRTRVFVHEGHYLQAVLRTPTVIQHVQHDTSVQEFLNSDTDEIWRKSSLDGQPLLRVAVFNSAYFVVTMNHSIYDAWSITNMFDLLERTYLANVPAGVDEHHLPQFKSFVKVVLDQDRVQAADFWVKFLSGTETKPLARTDGDSKRYSLLRRRVEIPAAAARHSANTHAEMVYAAVALALHHQQQTPDTVLRLISTGRTAPGVPDLAKLIGPTATRAPLRLRHAGGGGRLDEFLAHVRTQLVQVAQFEHFGFDTPDLERLCHAAPQVIVNQHEYHTEQYASKVGLRRHELLTYMTDGAPFTIDLSLVAQGNVLQAINMRVVFDDSAVDEKPLRRLITDFDVIIRRIISGAYWDKNTAALIDTEAEEVAMDGPERT